MYKSRQQRIRSSMRRWPARKQASLRRNSRPAGLSVLRETELSIPIDGVPGAEESILSTVTEQGTSVRALCSVNDRDQTVMLLVAEDAPLAKQALEEAGFDCTSNPVVVVGLENRIGVIDRLGVHLQDAGIDVLRSYASYANPQEVCAVFKTQDDERAIKVLQKGCGAAMESSLQYAV